MVIELTLVDGNPITLHLTGNFAVTPTDDGRGSVVDDGVHNNGGWPVRESYTEVIELLIRCEVEKIWKRTP